MEWIVDRRVDQLVVSVAGDDATHAELRSGSTLDPLWASIEELAARRPTKKTPTIKVSYLLTRRNCRQVPALVESAAQAGADELFVTHLDCTPSRELRDQAVFGASGMDPEAAEAIEAASRVARAHKNAFRSPALCEQNVLVCALDPLSVVFVSRDGRVGPCVYLALPIRGPIPRWDDRGPSEVEPVIYGQLAERSLRQILDDEPYRSFTGVFETRLAIERRFVGGMVGRSARENLDYLDGADRTREAELGARPFPRPCVGCHKSLGW
jgi:MoaA/NifB/PqqE/SkfB family radical SAM enzyme